MRRLVAVALLIACGVSYVIFARSARLRFWRLSDVATKLEARPTRGRLAGFAYTRQPRPEPDEHTIRARRLRVAANQLAVELARSSRGKDLHMAGVAFLLAGKAPEAVACLKRAVSAVPDSPAMWNDLAVARLALHDAAKDASQIIDALGDIDQSLRLGPGSAESLFNRAQILDLMGLEHAAAEQFERFLAIDPTSGWSGEARQSLSRLAQKTDAQEWEAAVIRLRRAASTGNTAAVQQIVTRFPQEARAHGETIFLEEWAKAVQRGEDAAANEALQLAAAVGEELVEHAGETLLRDTVAVLRTPTSSRVRHAMAAAHILYVEGRVLYATRQRAVSEALPRFRRAAEVFREHGSPIANVAEFYFSSCLYDLNRRQPALRILRRLRETTPRTHVALHAFIQWQLGSVHLGEGELQEALEAQSRATALFESIGEYGNANVIGSSAAATKSAIGRRDDAWNLRLRIFRRLSRSGDLAGLQRVLDVTARTEALSGAWQNAYSLLSLAIAARLRENPRVSVSSLIWHALAAHRLSIAGTIEPDLKTAAAVSASIRDPAMRLAAENDILFCRGATLRSKDARRAATLLDAYISGARAGGSLFHLSEALLERGRARRDLGDFPSAVHDFRETLDLTRGVSTSLPLAELRDAYFRSSASAARELADLLVRQGRGDEAFVVVDDERTHPYLDGTAIAPVAVSRRIPDQTTVIEYVALESHLLIFVVTRRTIRVVTVRIGEAALERAAMAFRQQRTEGAGDVALKELSTVLIRPVSHDIAAAERLVIVPDRAVAMIPFAALPIDAGRRLIHEVAVTVAPSALVASQRSNAIGKRPTSLLAVGNPAIDRHRFPELEPLPGAEREVRRVAAQYARSISLVGPAATRQTFLDALQHSEVIHLAAHAVLLRSDPGRSHIILAPTATDSGVLYLADIERVALNATRLVVLAGCDTATPPDARRNVDSLALAFVAAGASNVVGSLWPVEDEATAAFAISLHREIRRGSTPAEAVRKAQLSLLSSQQPHLRSLNAWAAYQVYGCGE